MEALRPLVFKKGGKQRLGKGFSLNELKKAGLNSKKALKLGISIDVRRRTMHEENVEKLKRLLEAKQQEETQKQKSKRKTEEERKEKAKRGKREKSKT
ncbi:MAG: ribosomal protein L13e [Candidatus Bathyarchaeia archaeon]